MPRLVIVESPYAGASVAEIARNVAYARACMADCLRLGDYPYASHLLFTQPGILRDGVPEERRLGIEAGLSWGRHAEATVVYSDLGYSSGMHKGIQRAKDEGRPVEERVLPDFDRRVYDIKNFEVRSLIARFSPEDAMEFLAAWRTLSPSEQAHMAVISEPGPSR